MTQSSQTSICLVYYNYNCLHLTCCNSFGVSFKELKNYWIQYNICNPLYLAIKINSTYSFVWKIFIKKWPLHSGHHIVRINDRSKVQTTRNCITPVRYKLFERYKLSNLYYYTYQGTQNHQHNRITIFLNRLVQYVNLQTL